MFKSATLCSGLTMRYDHPLRAAVTIVAGLMGFCSEDLILSLSTRKIQAGNDEVSKRLTLQQVYTDQPCHEIDIPFPYLKHTFVCIEMASVSMHISLESLSL